jgi:hypothetical protein
MTEADSVHSTPRRFTPKIERKNSQLMRMTLISPGPDHCPRPPGMGVFATSAMRLGGWPRPRRATGGRD